LKLGASDAIRQMNKTVKPIFEYSKDGEDYVAKASVPAMGKEHVHKFRLNVEQDETTLDGRKVKVRTRHRFPSFNVLSVEIYRVAEH